MIFKPAQLEHQLPLFLRPFFGGFAGLALSARLHANTALTGIYHLPSFGFGLLYVHNAPRLACFRLVTGYGVCAKFNSSVLVLLPCEDLRQLHCAVIGGFFTDTLYAGRSAGLAFQCLFDRFLRGAGRPLDFAVLYAHAFTRGDRHQRALHRRRLGDV